MKKKIVGLTGKMGSGKSTVARMIQNMLIPVFDADKAVHILMSDNREMIALFKAKIPESVEKDKINRSVLAELVAKKIVYPKQLEQMIYPFLDRELDGFFRRHKNQPVVVLDVPLLYEAGWDEKCDFIIETAADDEIIKKRVFERFGMTDEKYAALTARRQQTVSNRRNPDFIIDTGTDMAETENQINRIMEKICEKSF